MERFREKVLGVVKVSGWALCRELHALACLYWGLWFPIMGVWQVSLSSPVGRISETFGVVLTYLGLGHVIVNAMRGAQPVPPPVPEENHDDAC